VKEHLVHYISCINYILVRVKLMDLIELKLGWARVVLRCGGAQSVVLVEAWLCWMRGACVSGNKAPKAICIRCLQYCPMLGINLGILACASLQETFVTNRR
jgi:hypothetical protein